MICCRLRIEASRFSLLPKIVYALLPSKWICGSLRSQISSSVFCALTSLTVTPPQTWVKWTGSVLCLPLIALINSRLYKLIQAFPCNSSRLRHLCEFSLLPIQSHFHSSASCPLFFLLLLLQFCLVSVTRDEFECCKWIFTSQIRILNQKVFSKMNCFLHAINPSLTGCSTSHSSKTPSRHRLERVRSQSNFFPYLSFYGWV